MFNLLWAVHGHAVVMETNNNYHRYWGNHLFYNGAQTILAEWVERPAWRLWLRLIKNINDWSLMRKIMPFLRNLSITSNTLHLPPCQLPPPLLGSPSIIHSVPAQPLIFALQTYVGFLLLLEENKQTRQEERNINKAVGGIRQRGMEGWNEKREGCWGRGLVPSQCWWKDWK